MSSAPDLTTRILRHQRLVVVGGVVLLALLSWLFLIGGAGMGHEAMMPGPPPLSALVIMWWVMMAAMMLPSATPAILLYARIREMRTHDSVIAESWVFAIGYLAVWLLFSLVAASAQWMLAGPSMALKNRMAGGALLLAAGIYQLSPLKAACIRQCRSPAQFISHHWRSGWQGAIRLGFLHGAYCVGCCWMLMALLFVGGIMNLLWITALTIVVAVEKFASRGPLFGQAVGVSIICWGLMLLLD